jgi:Uncharacterized proteins involved in stress response, homologs of TerZ and putative cAMP-binding protein CABP1
MSACRRRRRGCARSASAWAGTRASPTAAPSISTPASTCSASPARSAPIPTSSSSTTSPAPAARSSTQGDNLTGVGDGDDEVVVVTLDKLGADVAKISFAVTIYEADHRRQNFGMVQNAFIRVVNGDGGTEIARYDLSEDASTETAMIFGELYRHGGEWKFKAIGQGFAGGLSPLARSFGVSV